MRQKMQNILLFKINTMSGNLFKHFCVTTPAQRHTTTERYRIVAVLVCVLVDTIFGKRHKNA